MISQDGTIAYVDQLGWPLAEDRRPDAPTGLSRADKVVVDKRGIASTGTVTRIDLNYRTATHTIAVELHPTAILWDEPRATLYVANGNKDSVSVIDTKSQRVVRTIAIQPFSQNVTGIAPTALAISPDGAKIYVACGGINAVAVVDAASVENRWADSDSLVSEFARDEQSDGKRLAVSSLLGPGSAWRETPENDSSMPIAVRSVLSICRMHRSLRVTARSSRRTITCSFVRLNLCRRTSSRGAVKPQAIPARSGDPTPIEHVVYIIKENRTYDQVFGDLPQGNGDPSLVMFGRDVTPNQHRLAEQFVMLDNFYATGGNSADGHQWVTQANETAYCMWPGYAGRSYPFDGTDPIAYASGGFLWDYALATK